MTTSPCLPKPSHHPAPLSDPEICYKNHKNRKTVGVELVSTRHIHHTTRTLHRHIVYNIGWEQTIFLFVDTIVGVNQRQRWGNTHMRMALLSDIHGNPIALDAVLKDIAAQGGVDSYWILGDF